MRLIGWGKTPSGTSYWLVANSWGVALGDKGVHWIELGKNTVGIEQEISAPVVSVRNPCDDASFCDRPMSQPIAINITDTNSHPSMSSGT